MSSHVRLFFALWPSDPIRLNLWDLGGKLQKIWNGRRMKPDTLHLTLVFLGDTPVARLDELKKLAADIKGKKFSMELDRASCWRHNKVGFASPEEIPLELPMLVHSLEDSLEAQGFAFDARPYKPHVTLLRNTRCTTQVPFVPVTWKVEEFALIASSTTEQGVNYRLLGRWPLGS